MDQRAKRKFQVIGACARTQTLSLDEEIRLIEGVPYNLDIFQDFSVSQLDGSIIRDISTLDLCIKINETENGDVANCVVNQAPKELDYQERMLVRKAMEKESEMLRWEEKEDKKSGKKGLKKWKKAMSDLGVDYD